MTEVTTETPKDLVGRDPTELERMAIADGFLPDHRIGDQVVGNHESGNGEIDAIVLFNLQPHSAGYTWGCRLKGSSVYFAQHLFKKVATTTQ